MADAIQLTHTLPESRKLRHHNDLIDGVGKIVKGYGNVKRQIARKAKRIPGVKSIAGSRPLRKVFRGTSKYAGPVGIGLAIGDTQLVRSITQFDIPAIGESFVDAVRYLPEAAAYIYNNPKEAANEILWEGLAVGAGESVITLYENASPTGYVYDHKTRTNAWIADSQGGHTVSYVDKKGNPKTTVEKQEYVYSYHPDPKNPRNGRLLVSRPAEGLTERRDLENKKVRELLRVPVAEFEIKDGRVTREIERNSDGSTTIHTYDDSNPTYTCLNASGYTSKLDEYVETNEIFARYGIPETKHGEIYGQETATDVLNAIQIGRRVSSQTNEKGKSMTIVDWNNSQDDKIVFADRYEATDTTTFYVPQSKDESIREDVTIVQSVHSVSYRDLERLGINISGDKNDPKVRERLLKDITAKLTLIKDLPTHKIEKPQEEATITKHSYVNKLPHSEYTTGYERFYKEHPLFGERYGTYASEVIDYDSNVVQHYDTKGNLVMTTTYDTSSEANHYQYRLNNVFVPTDTEGIDMQFTPSGEFLGFQSDDKDANFFKMSRLQEEKALLSDFNSLKEAFGVETLPEIRKELEKMSKTEDVSAWLEVVDDLEKQDLTTFDSQKIDLELKKCEAKEAQFEKQFAELDKKYIQRDKDGNVRIKTKDNSYITGKEVVETDEEGNEYKVIKADYIPHFAPSSNPDYIPNMMESSLVARDYQQFPVTDQSNNAFFTKSEQNDGLNYYRINYNGTAETQNYGGYVQENPITKVCHVFNRNGECIYIDVPNDKVKDDENWATNPQSDKYLRIQNMIIESDRGGIDTNDALLTRIDDCHRKQFPKEYADLLSEYKKFVQKPLELPNEPGKYINYDYYLPNQCEKTTGVTTNKYIEKQYEYLDKMEGILNGIQNPSPEIAEEKKALAEQRKILQSMQKKPETERIKEVVQQAQLIDKQIKRVGDEIPNHVSTIKIDDYISDKDENLSEQISICHKQSNPAQTVYRLNSRDKKCAGIIVEDKQSGVCQIYDVTGCLIDVDRPMSNSLEEMGWYTMSGGGIAKTSRYQDMVDKVDTRWELYKYAKNPERECPELCANEDRLIYQQRLSEAESFQEITKRIEEPINIDTGIIALDPSELVSTPEILDCPILQKNAIPINSMADATEETQTKPKKEGTLNNCAVKIDNDALVEEPEKVADNMNNNTR